MKVIFLDHQGVMRLDKHPNPGKLAEFDSECVKTLNLLIKETDAEIVVSSDWKYWVSLEQMSGFYLSQGILKKPIDYTPKTKKYIFNIINKQRSEEINCWLENKKNIKKWVSIDDLDMTIYLKNFILTEVCYGIKKDGIKDEIINFLT